MRRERDLEGAVERGGGLDLGIDARRRVAVALGVLRLLASLPQEVRTDRNDEEDAGDDGAAREALGESVVRAGLLAQLLVALAHVVEEADLGLEVVADDVAVPALRQRLDEV